MFNPLSMEPVSGFHVSFRGCNHKFWDEILYPRFYDGWYSNAWRIKEGYNSTYGNYNPSYPLNKAIYRVPITPVRINLGHL